MCNFGLLDHNADEKFSKICPALPISRKYIDANLGFLTMNTQKQCFMGKKQIFSFVEKSTHKFKEVKYNQFIEER